MAKRPATAKTTTRKPSASSTAKSADESAASGWSTDAMSEVLNEARKKATDLFQNPVARSLLAAGLVTAAAAIASNKNVRDATKRNIREAQEATGSAFEAASESANRVGAVIINAAVEAVEKMMGGTSGATETPAAAAAAPAPAATAKPKAPRKPATAKKPAAPKPAAKAAPAAAKPRTPKPAAAKSATTASKASPSKANGTGATAKPRTRRAKPAGGTASS